MVSSLRSASPHAIGPLMSQAPPSQEPPTPHAPSGRGVLHVVWVGATRVGLGATLCATLAALIEALVCWWLRVEELYGLILQLWLIQCLAGFAAGGLGAIQALRCDETDRDDPTRPAAGRSGQWGLLMSLWGFLVFQTTDSVFLFIQWGFDVAEALLLLLILLLGLIPGPFLAMKLGDALDRLGMALRGEAEDPDSDSSGESDTRDAATQS